LDPDSAIDPRPYREIPLLQMPILAPLTFWTTARWMTRGDAAPPDVPKSRQ
jgi:hypothetical protein